MRTFRRLCTAHLLVVHIFVTMRCRALLMTTPYSPWRPTVEQGNHLAHGYMGNMYMQVRIHLTQCLLPPESLESHRHCLLPTDLLHIVDLFLWHFWLLQGKGVPVNHDRAVKHFKIAAEKVWCFAGWNRPIA